MKSYDRIIIGGGLFGLYSTLKSVEKGLHVLLLEKERELFLRASYVNQARVHCGMHYLRDNKTAKLCAKYYNRFIAEHKECINNSFKAIYANSKLGSLVSDYSFKQVLDSLDIPFHFIEIPTYLNNSNISVCAEVEESSFDYQLLLLHYLKKLSTFKNLVDVHRAEEAYNIIVKDDIAIVNNLYQTGFILNCTYASTNNVISLIKGAAHNDLYDLRYELCEVALCDVDRPLNNIGLTIMDGPFFSIMPFGNSKYHSLTSVGHTPHYSCEDRFPMFKCQRNNCHPHNLLLCNSCKNKPQTCFEKMRETASLYLKANMIKYIKSLYTVKPILKSSELNDSRPTIITQHCDSPYIYSVLSGKISSIYELDSIL